MNEPCKTCGTCPTCGRKAKEEGQPYWRIVPYFVPTITAPVYAPMPVYKWRDPLPHERPIVWCSSSNVVAS